MRSPSSSAFRQLVPVIARAQANGKTRDAWLERLWQALKADQIPYIEQLGDCWGELCVSKEVAMAWADRLVGVTRVPFSPDPNLRGYFPGTSACLSALFCVERYAEIVELVGGIRSSGHTSAGR